MESYNVAHECYVAARNTQLFNVKCNLSGTETTANKLTEQYWSDLNTALADQCGAPPFQ